MVNNGKSIDSAVVEGSTVYLRVSALHGSGAAPYYRGKSVPGSGIASFLYSPDNRSFKTIGNELHMRFNLRIFTGNKFCLFNYATSETGGYVDFDWFRTERVHVSLLPTRKRTCDATNTEMVKRRHDADTYVPGKLTYRHPFFDIGCRTIESSTRYELLISSQTIGRPL